MEKFNRFNLNSADRLGIDSRPNKYNSISGLEQPTEIPSKPKFSENLGQLTYLFGN